MSGNSASHLGASRRRSFDPVRLEQELNELWNDLTEDNNQVSRACLSNLVIAMPEEYDVSQLVADITERHPSRVLIVRQCKRLNPGQLEAFVSASCSKRSEGTVVCCESITLDYGVGGERALPNAIRSLFVGTQSRVLVIKQLAWSDLGWVQELGRSLDVILADSALMSPRASIELWRRVQSPDYHRSYRDLVWTRLIDWRKTLARAFDDTDVQSAISDIKTVDIELANRPDCLAPGALLVGWLADRLDWSFVEADSKTAEFLSKTQLVRVMVSQREAGHDPARIRSVRIGFGEARYPLQLVRYSEDKAISMSIDSHRHSRVNQIKTTRASAVVREMQRMGMNSVAAAAMAKAAPVLEAWGKKS